MAGINTTEIPVAPRSGETTSTVGIGNETPKGPWEGHPGHSESGEKSADTSKPDLVRELREEIQRLEAERDQQLEDAQKIVISDRSFGDLGVQHRANSYAALMRQNRNLNEGMSLRGEEIMDLRARLKAVEKLHKPVEDHPVGAKNCTAKYRNAWSEERECFACSTGEKICARCKEVWPCQDIRAARGE